MNRKKILVNNTMWVYVAKLLAQMVSVLATVLVIRQLPVNVYGTYTFLFGVFTLYQLFITSPLRQVIMRFIPEFSNFLSVKSIWQLVKSYFIIALVKIAALTVVIVVFKEKISFIFNMEGLQEYLQPFLIFVFSYALKILLDVVLSALLMHKKLAIQNMVVAFIRASAYIILLSKLDVGLLLNIESIVSLVFIAMSICHIYFISSNVAPEKQAQLPQKDKKRFRKFWIYSIFTEIGVGIIGRTSDLYIVAALSNPYFIGLYGFAVKIYDLFYKVLPLKEYESVLKPLVFDRYQENTSDTELNSFYNFCVKVMLPIFILPFLYFTIFGQNIIYSVFEVKYLGAYWTTVVVLLGLVLNGLFYPLGIIVHLKEKLHVQLYSRILVVFSLLMGVYLMGKWGIVGVAIATLLGEFIKNLVMFILFRPYCRINYDKSIFINYSFLIAFMLLMLLPLSYLISDPILNLIIGSVLFVFFYVTYIVNFHALKSSELQNLKSILESNDRLRIFYKPIARIMGKLVLFKRVYE